MKKIKYTERREKLWFLSECITDYSWGKKRNNCLIDSRIEQLLKNNPDYVSNLFWNKVN